MKQIVLHQAHLQAMHIHVAAEAPLEACGLVAGHDGLSVSTFAMRNELASRTLFRMDARQQVAAFLEIERAGWDLLAIYHSHPAGPEEPSQSDLVEAYYPGVAQLIWSQADGIWGCHAYLLDNNRSIPIEFQVSGEQLSS
ncbi:MAG: M67 family metallopeptidase [Anaerolineales bacterium]